MSGASNKVHKLLKRGGIVGVTGENGSGKTAMAVDYAIQQADKGVIVVSTVPFTHDNYRRVVSWDTILSIPFCGLPPEADHSQCQSYLILLDEIEVVASSRDTMTLVPEARVMLATLRHRHCRLIWTAPTWPDVDVKIRRVTQFVLMAQRIPVPFTAPDPGGWPGTVLTRAQLRRVVRGDGIEPRPDDKKTAAAWVWLPKLLSRGRYNTYAETDELGSSNECGTCGLPKPRRTCRCKHPDPAPLPTPRLVQEIPNDTDTERGEEGIESAGTARSGATPKASPTALAATTHSRPETNAPDSVPDGRNLAAKSASTERTPDQMARSARNRLADQ